MLSLDFLKSTGVSEDWKIDGPPARTKRRAPEILYRERIAVELGS